MSLSPWFRIGADGPPVRGGRYLFEIFLPDVVVTVMATYPSGANYIITDDARIIGLTYEDMWRGVKK